MTGWVERKPALSSSVVPTGAHPHMPPSIQGAERRGRRWALRALVIGGLAGAAWLLTGTAAQAADHEEGSSLLGVVVDSAAKPIVHNVLKVAAQPLDEVRTAPEKHRPITKVLNIPARVIGAHGAHDVDHVVKDLTGTLRLTGGPAGSDQLAQVAAPLTRPLRTVTGSTPDARPVAPQHADDQLAPPLPAVDELPTPPSAGEHGTQRPAPAAKPVARVAAATRIADVAAVTHVATTKSRGKQQHAPVIKRHAVTAAAPGSSTPGDDRHAPQPVQLGALSGISTSASGAPTEGGSAAFLPAAVANGSVAHHRLRKATDVEVRRYDAEAPTVSPD